MEGGSIDYQNFELLISDAEFIPPARCADRGPESGKPRAEDQDSVHVATPREQECKIPIGRVSPTCRPNAKIAVCAPGSQWRRRRKGAAPRRIGVLASASRGVQSAMGRRAATRPKRELFIGLR